MGDPGGCARSSAPAHRWLPCVLLPISWRRRYNAGREKTTGAVRYAHSDQRQAGRCADAQAKKGFMLSRAEPEVKAIVLTPAEATRDEMLAVERQHLELLERDCSFPAWCRR